MANWLSSIRSAGLPYPHLNGCRWNIPNLFSSKKILCSSNCGVAKISPITSPNSQIWSGQRGHRGQPWVTDIWLPRMLLCNAWSLFITQKATSGHSKWFMQRCTEWLQQNDQSKKCTINLDLNWIHCQVSWTYMTNIFDWEFKSRSVQLNKDKLIWKSQKPNYRFSRNTLSVKCSNKFLQYTFMALLILCIRIMFIKSYPGWSHLIRKSFKCLLKWKALDYPCDLHTVNFTLLKYIDITFRDWLTIRMSTILCKMDKILKIYLVTIFQIWIYWFILRAVRIVNQESYVLDLLFSDNSNSLKVCTSWTNKFNNSKHWFNFLPSNSHHVNIPELLFPRYRLFEKINVRPIWHPGGPKP